MSSQLLIKGQGSILHVEAVFRVQDLNGRVLKIYELQLFPNMSPLEETINLYRVSFFWSYSTGILEEKKTQSKTARTKHMYVSPISQGRNNMLFVCRRPGLPLGTRDDPIDYPLVGP